MTARAALAAAARGWHVFPCDGKRPRASWRWTAWNTTDPARIAEWFAADCPVGIACGPSGLVVIDLDTASAAPLPPPWDTVPGVVDGSDVYAVLAEGHGEGWPDTYTVRTPRGGWHFYFQAGGYGIRNSASEIGPMIDVRGDGGYVVAAGSVRDDGEYTLINDRAPAPLPSWLAALATRAREEPEARAAPGVLAPKGDAYVRAALEGEVRAVVTASPGHRNHQLNKSAFALARFVADGQLPRETVIEVLTLAAQQAGLTASETRGTIESGLKGRRA